MELTEKEQTIKELTEADELTVAGIADKLGVTPGSVYQSLKKLRDAGELPPSKAKRGRPAGSKNGITSAESTPEPVAEQNGHVTVTVEAQVKHELESVEARVSEITEQVASLEVEKGELALRAEVLGKVTAVLTEKS